MTRPRLSSWECLSGNRSGRPEIRDDTTQALPTTELGLTGLTCSGGGIRSAAFCLGVLQGLQSRKVIDDMDYLSTDFFADMQAINPNV